ncbi:GTPase ObgE [Leptospira sp. GIMC2001]|uniref:GTPase ObgE n=1 Tax=Leptospira sp. GIMC2001 TaxID=1513297 RepID=UPI00234B3F64|nr:GTPase ObgE [Leptospira sp. GIMC2001]WCL51351.1 GTPase ObgE [Leptospira sp. GIMC2001]
MSKFIDEVSISLKAGHGGAGSVHFRHEKYAEFGGPDGGDGGKGGNIILRSRIAIQTLDKFRPDKTYAAEVGDFGRGQKRDGKDGEDLVLLVPIGTQVIDKVTMECIYDFTEEVDFVIARGGRGGKGNTFFKSSTLQAPKFAQPGEPGEEREVLLTLKLLADLGIVGFPNAGKSTLLSKITEAQPKIANYSFTTLIPNLGVVKRQSDSFRYTIADIPGIIEGASRGLGLGLSFLKHIERVKGILFLLDGSRLEIEHDLALLRAELESYDPLIMEKPFLIVLNKVDLWESDPNFTEEIMNQYSQLGEIVPISAEKNINIELLLDRIDQIFFPIETNHERSDIS